MEAYAESDPLQSLEKTDVKNYLFVCEKCDDHDHMKVRHQDLPAIVKAYWHMSLSLL